MHLWVRESFAQIYTEEDCIHRDEWDRGPEQCPPHCPGCKIEYKADTDAKYPGGWDDGEDPECPRWKSPYHMHRWQSRINLEIKSVRVEQLQDITEADAKAEGVEPHAPSVIDDRIYRRPFEALWDLINAKRGFPWSSNPLVWVIEFERKL